MYSITRRKLAETLYTELRKEFPEKTILFYHGDNYKIDSDGGVERYHDQTKKEAFIDVELTWRSADVLIYTNTLTVGVDFNTLQFDKFIGVFISKTSSADGFIQSLLRVRKFKSQTHQVYLFTGESDANLTGTTPMA